MASERFTLTFTPGPHSIEIPPGLTILEAARLTGLNLAAPCGGAGRCGKCLVKVTSMREENSPQWVLACQTTVRNSMNVELPGSPLLILEKGQIQPVALEPAVFTDDHGMLKHRAGIPMENTYEGRPLLGLAVDLGTTTLVSYLYDLTSGQPLAVASGENGQLSYGADVISRLAYALQGDVYYRELRQALAASLDQLFLDCCRLAGVHPCSIREIVIVGNTPMIHLLINLPVQGLAAAPFRPAARGPFYRNASELGLNSVDGAVCYLPPLIGGFVGSDALAAALARGFGLPAVGTELLVDIGTNGEILMQAGEKLLAASAPAGPALEGGNIQCGMLAATGAISKVIMDYDVHPVVIGDGKPVGICGSGLVDTIAEMLRLGLIDSSGRLVNPSELPPVISFKIKQRLLQNHQYKRFILSGDVYLDQRDIREVQLAKAAVAAGIKVVLAESGLGTGDLDALWLSGGFGNYLNPANALRIGLFGEVDCSKIHQVGNAAGSGAIMMLLSFAARERAEILSKRFRHLELASDQRYREIFIQQLNFPDKECGV